MAAPATYIMPRPATPAPCRPASLSAIGLRSPLFHCRMPRSVKRDDIQFPAKHSALRDDVHVLGALVGDVLKEQGGDGLFDLVEKDRRLSIRRRAGDKEAAAELSVQLRGRAPQVARDLARAFSMWFRAVNLAEKVHRIRRRRGYFLEASERAQPGGVEAALHALKARGLKLSDVLELLKKIRIEPVFTAHPTESARRTMLRKNQRIAGLLLDRLDPTLTPQELRQNWSRVRTEITTAWQTEDHPRERLTVADEREHVVFYLAEILYRILPAFYDELAEALGKLFGVQPDSLELPNILRFGTWVGGDMDGNPDVHAKSIRETLARQQQVIINAYFSECQNLAQLLSQSASRSASSCTRHWSPAHSASHPCATIACRTACSSGRCRSACGSPTTAVRTHTKGRSSSCAT